MVITFAFRFTAYFGENPKKIHRTPKRIQLFWINLMSIQARLAQRTLSRPARYHCPPQGLEVAH